MSRGFDGGGLEPHRGTTILVLGILGIVMSCLPLGPVALYLGGADMKKIKAGTMDPTGEQTTRIGYILGIVGTVFTIITYLSLCAYIALIVLALGAASQMSTVNTVQFNTSMRP